MRRFLLLIAMLGITVVACAGGCRTPESNNGGYYGGAYYGGASGGSGTR